YPSEILEYPTGECGNGTANWTIKGSNTGLFNVGQITVDASGDVFVGDLGNNVIKEFAAGSCTNATSPCNIAPTLTAGGFGGPFGIGLDSSGDIFTALLNANDLASFTSTGS